MNILQFLGLIITAINSILGSKSVERSSDEKVLETAMSTLPL